jgi:hypothetical protein
MVTKSEDMEARLLLRFRAGTARLRGLVRRG